MKRGESFFRGKTFFLSKKSLQRRTKSPIRITRQLLYKREREGSEESVGKEYEKRGEKKRGGREREEEDREIHHGQNLMRRNTKGGGGGERMKKEESNAKKEAKG